MPKTILYGVFFRSVIGKTLVLGGLRVQGLMGCASAQTCVQSRENPDFKSDTFLNNVYIRSQVQAVWVCRVFEGQVMNAIGKSPTLRVIVDRSRCCGYGLCAQLCPEVYKLDENGLVFVESETIPGGLEEEAKEGAAACPAEALVIEEMPS